MQFASFALKIQTKRMLFSENYRTTVSFANYSHESDIPLSEEKKKPPSLIRLQSAARLGKEDKIVPE